MDTPTSPNLIFIILQYMHVWCPIIALIFALFRARLFGRLSLIKFAENLLTQLIFWVIGIECILIFILHTWFPRDVLYGGNWTNIPTLYQIGMVNLSFGILGISSMLSSLSFQVATTLGYSIWIFGDGIGHLIFEMKGINDPVGIASVLYTDLAIPFVLVILLMIVYQNTKSKG